MPPCRSSGEELAGLTHHQQSRIFQVKRQVSRRSIAARTLRQAKSSTETLTSLPAPRAPIQQVQRSRNPPGNDGNGSPANALGCSWCQTIPLPEESGAKAARAKSSGSRSRLLQRQRGKTQELCAGSGQGTQRWHCHTEPLQPAKVSASSTARRRAQGTSSRSPHSWGWQSRILPLQTLLLDPRASPLAVRCHSVTRSWEREEKPLGVTALLGMPGGRIPPLTPTPGAVTSCLSSPMP